MYVFFFMLPISATRYVATTSESSQKMLNARFIWSSALDMRRSVMTIPGEIVQKRMSVSLYSFEIDLVNWVIALLDAPYTL